MIILNEVDYAEKTLRDLHFDGKPYQTLIILAKYFYYKHGYSKKKIVDELCEFMEKSYPRYSEDKKGWRNTIEQIAGNCKKYPIYEIEGIWITKSELEKIGELENPILERLAFTILCLAKLATRKNPSSNGWVNDSTRDLFSLARISGSTDQREVRIGMLRKNGLLEFPKRTDSLSVRVTFMNDESENELFIHDFRELGYEYLNYKGGNFIRCAECGILTRGNKNGTKRYCSSCAAYEPIGTKRIICVDCGKEFNVDGNNKRTIRCLDCQNELNKSKKKQWWKENKSSK